MFNEPTTPQSLRTLQLLSRRKKQTPKEEMRRRHLRRGLVGEQQLHNLLQAKLTSPCIPLYGLQLESDMSEFQVDCLLIFHNAIHLLEVKNYYGDFTVDNQRWYHVATMDEIRNPLDQLARAQRLLSAFLQKNDVNLPVTSYLIFMNPTFYLYGADRAMPIIFPGQHESYLKQLNRGPKHLGTYHQEIANHLTAAHIVQSRHEYVPVYNYAELQKGIFCENCATPLEKRGGKFFTCGSCENKETVGSSLLQAVKDFQLLFPDRPLTVEGISHWTGEILSKSTIRHCLAKHFARQSRGRGTYYC